jgi:diguanylate cyclase (GGDEF)-like protein/PAS domain S-box-containing protein
LPTLRRRLLDSLRARLPVATFGSDPLGMVRWIFVVFNLASATLLMGVLGAEAASGRHVVGLAALLLPCLGLKWFEEFRGRAQPFSLDVLEAAALLVVGVASGSPLTVLVLLYGRVALRALLDPTGRLVALTAANIAAFLGALFALRVLDGAGTQPVAYLFLASGFALVAPSMHVLGMTLRRLDRAVAREFAMRRAIARLNCALADAALPRAAVDAVYSLINREDIDVAIALGPPDDCRIAATSRATPSPGIIGRPIDASAWTDEQRARIREGGLQLDGDELARLWPSERSDQPQALFVADIAVGGESAGMMFVSGASVPREDTVAVVTLVEHIALRLEAAAMTRKLQNRESETNFRRLFDANPQPMWLYDANTFDILIANDATVENYGYSREELLTMRVDDLYDASADPHSSREHSRRRREAREQTTHRTKDGTLIEVQVDSSTLVFQARDVVLMLARDVTEERELHKMLEHQTLHDLLTGLPNRRLLEAHVRRALARAERLPDHQPAVLVLDLDGFKTINDTLGHALGDRVITAVAERLVQSLRPGDTASRTGGDEFAVLLEDTSGAADAVLVAQRLVAEIQRPLDIDGRSVAVSASVGIALPQPGHAAVEDIVGDADIAMYVAKAEGTGSCVLFESRYRRALVERLTLQEELGAAVREGHLAVHYQPQLELATGRVVAVEALVRWPHRTRGLVPPDEFIPVGEQMGLIPAIDAWVLQTACNQLRRWCEDGLPSMRIAVNLSSSDLERADLVELVRRVLLECMLDPWQLELELTESIAVGQPEAAVGRLAELRAMGVRIAIDDFGTGYSMFSRLRDLPVDRLKIDRSFVTDITKDDDARAIVGSTIAMGHALGLDLVAEGVEDEATAAVLREMHCDSAQGYHFAHPLSAEALSAWLRTRLDATQEPVRAAVR